MSPHASKYAAIVLGISLSGCSSASISVWQTARDTGDRLSPQPALAFTSPGPISPNTSELVVNASEQLQTVWGFGGALTESSVHVFSKLDAATQASFLADLYGENSNGTSLRYTAGRLTIGSCDFALEYCKWYAELTYLVRFGPCPSPAQTTIITSRTTLRC